MAAKRRVIVSGANGVFGSLVVRELEARGDLDVIALARADLDVNDTQAVRRASTGAFAFVCAAGPFQAFSPGVVAAVVDAGAHWLDISDDPAWFFGLLDDTALDAAARSANVAVLPGLSSLPAISGALVRRARERAPAARNATITLVIGNRNRKGAGAIASALGGDGRTIITPDREFLRRELAIEVETQVKLDAPLARPLLALVSKLGLSIANRLRVARVLSRLAAPLGRFGSDRGGITVAMDGIEERLEWHGQRPAILPIAFAIDRLLRHSIPGCHAPLHAFDFEDMLHYLEARR